MRKLAYLLTISFAFMFYSCDNEVDLNAEFEDTTVVYGLINAYDDTNFVKINRAFLEDGKNAIELAGDADNLFYENLNVQLISPSRGDTFKLNTIEKPKDPGVFSNARNIVYYTDENLAANTSYTLKVTQADGKVTTGTTTTLERTQIIRPPFVPGGMGARRPISFVRIIVGSLSYQDYEFEFKLTEQTSEIQVKLYLHYIEIVNNDSVPRRAEVSVGGLTNRELANENFSIEYNGEFFYRAIASVVPNNGNKKVVPLEDNIEIEVVGVDPVYNQYVSIYGPLDGIAQVRPEFTNIENGIGLLSSRSLETDFSFLAQESRTELLSGRYTGNLGVSNP